MGLSAARGAPATNRHASAAVTALEGAGIPADDISIVSNYDRDDTSNAAEGAGAGAGLGALAGGT
ncbi:hypothetical protein CO661_02650, partial [Sinorhizobium fredii]